MYGGTECPSTLFPSAAVHWVRSVGRCFDIQNRADVPSGDRADWSRSRMPGNSGNGQNRAGRRAVLVTRHGFALYRPAVRCGFDPHTRQFEVLP